MRMQPSPAVTGETCARTCNPEARLPDHPQEIGLVARLPKRVRNEWATGRLRPANPRAEGARSAAFARVGRRGRRAITDTEASAQPAPAAAAEGGIVVAEGGTAVAAGADRSKGKPWQERIQFI